MSIKSKIIRNSLSFRIRAIDKFISSPLDVQDRVFKRLIKTLSNTLYGKERGITRDSSYSDFRNKIPISTYENIEPYITRMRKGEKGVLWDTDVKWFAKSSGTTNDKSKFIPVTKEGLWRCHYMGGFDLMALNTHNNPNTKMFDGKTLTLGGSHKIEAISKGVIRTGDISAIMIHHVPLILNALRLPSKKTALIADFDEKIEMICKECSNKDVSIIAGVPSWNLVMLNKILEYTGKNYISDIWPNIEMFFHGGVNFSPYEEEYKRIINSPNMKFNDNYNASEGFFALQNELDDNSMLLMLDYGVFYEFIPTSTLDDHSTAVSIEGVKVDVNYAMIISSINGLWRYIIGDTIKFTSTSPYKIKITGRTKLFINVFGEEVIIDNAETAISKACEECNAVIHEYSVAPIYMNISNKGLHEWAIEFTKEPKNIERFTDILDKTLKSINTDYEAKRTNNATLIKPKITILKQGTFLKWFETKGKSGGQNKVPRLFNDRRYIDKLITINNE